MSPTYTVASDQCRRTPPWLYRACRGLAGVDDFALDAFASADNALCLDYLDGSPGRDGIIAPWADATFANPPFKLMAAAVRKATMEARRGVRSVLIGPVGCSQAWFRELWPFAVVYWPTLRLVYLDRAGRPTRGAMRDSAVYVLDGRCRVIPEVRELDGRSEVYDASDA